MSTIVWIYVLFFAVMGVALGYTIALKVGWVSDNEVQIKMQTRSDGEHDD